MASVTKGSAAVDGWAAVNQTISYQYDANGRIESITTADGITTFAYDGFGRLTEIADPAGNTSTLTYDALDRVIERTVGANIPQEALTIAYSYDEIGRLLNEQVDPSGLALTTQYKYDTGGSDTWNLQQIIDPLGYDTEYAYNSLGLRSQMTDAEGQNWTFQHDNLGRLLEMSDPLAKTTAYQYDALGRRTGMTDANGATTSYQYDALGNLTHMIDALGHITELEYDEMSRLSQRTAPLGQTISYDYDTVGNVISITDPLGNATTYTYDSANQLAQSTNANNQTTSFAHDGMGRVSAITDPSDITTGYTYDSAGYLVSTTDGLGRTTEYVYDAVGRLTDKIDAQEVVSHYSYDKAGRLAAVTENYRPGVTPNEETNVVTEYTYDANGNLLRVLDANGNAARSYQYNARNQVSTLSNALGHSKSYTYTERGELASLTDAKGQTTSYQYSDLAGQLTAISRPDETVSFQYDELGRLEEMLDSLGTTSFTYDDLSRLTAVTDPFGKTVGYGYDALGNRTSLTYPNLDTVDYTYDPLRRIDTVTDWQGDVTDYGYDNSSRLASIVYPNSVTTNLTYDDAHQLTNLQHAVGSTLANFAYQYDAVGNRTRATEQLAGSNSTIDYDYDALYRLTDADYDDGTFFDYAYDAVGNRTSKSDNTGTTNYTYDAANRLTSVNGQAYSYDDNGNLLSDGTSTYTYDVADRLKSVLGGGNLTEFAYNGLGNRLQQTINGTPTTYQLDLNTSLPQVLSDGTNSYLYGNGRIGEVGTSGWAYHHPDALGSVRLLTNGAGSVTGQASYTPFGEVMTSSTADSAFGFAGEQTDETGLQYLRARYYAPEQGRFLTTDPFSGMPGTPATLHPYMYGLNNPLIYVDPSGQCYGIFSFVRDYEPVGCGNLDLANSIASHPNATTGQWAGAAAYQVSFVGSHAGLAAGSAMLAWAWTPASVTTPVVSAIARHPQIATGAVGGISGFVGNIFGQLTNEGFRPSCINWTNALIAGVVGVGAGALAPYATNSIQAAILGAYSNFTQYLVTQITNGDWISPLDVLLSIGTGSFAGWFGGGYEPGNLQILLGHPSLSLATRMEQDMIQASVYVWPVFSSNTIRNILGGYFTNTNLADTDFFQSEDNCGSEEPPVEATEESQQHITQGQILQETAEVNVCTN